MAEKASDGLPYGQFGRAIYDSEDGKWTFSRRTESLRRLCPVGEPRMIAKRSVVTSGYDVRGDDQDVPSRRREKQTKVLIESFPEMQSAAQILPQLARVSEAVEHAASQYDSSPGQLIALGKMYDEGRRGYVDALAFPVGPTGSDLRMIQGLKQRQGWSEDRSSWIEVSDFSGEEATWRGPGVRILSIYFAQPLETGEHYLAVRLHTETLLFRPVLSKGAAPVASRLDLNLLSSISIAETGGLPHMHLAFNPWFTGQVAIVDLAGDWSVWETGRKSSTAKKIRSGSATDERVKKRKRSLDDDWAHIAWVESASTICIALRRKLVLVDLEAADELAPVVVDVGLKKGLGCILDVATVQVFLSHLFVLTSSHIIICCVARSDTEQIKAETITRIRHHRAPEDITLRMTLSEGNNNVVLVLRSAFSSLINQFWFSVSDTGEVQLQPPAVFDLPADIGALGLSDLHLENVLFIDKDVEDDNNTNCFWHMYLLGKDSTLSQTLYTFEIHQGHGGPGRSPGWTAAVSKLTKNSKPVFGGFIDDGVDESTFSCKLPLSKYAQRRRLRSSKGWTISYERTVQRLSEPSIRQSIDIEEIIEEVSALLMRPNSASERSIESLWEVAGPDVNVSDIEGASARIDRLHQLQPATEITEGEDESQAGRLTVIHIVPSSARKMLGLHDLESLSQATQTLRLLFGASGGSSRPRATVAARDSLLSQMAAEITLASQCLKVQEHRPEEVGASQNPSRAWELPVRLPPVDEISRDPKAIDAYARSRSHTPALPTPSASASTVTGSSHPSTFAAPEVDRLRKYTTFSKDAPRALPRTLNKVLSHWTIGANPAEYDWQSTARQVSRRDEDADDDEMTEKERRQMQRRTERYMRRQRREAEESQRQQMLSSQAPEIVSASQPPQRQGFRRVESSASAGAAAGSSQSFGFSQMVASQVVPGRHGGRPPPKKKRKSGF